MSDLGAPAEHRPGVLRAAVQRLFDYLSDLGQGGWALVLGCLIVLGLVVAVIVGRGGTSACDQGVKPVHDVRLYDGSHSLGGEGQQVLHEDSTKFGALASQSTGALKQAYAALAADAGRATEGQPFHAKASLAGYESACG
jgi:hypothetical protein